MLAKGRYIANGSKISDKMELPKNWSKSVDLPETEIKNFMGSIEPLELKPGDKIYRVSDANGSSRAYWTEPNLKSLMM